MFTQPVKPKEEKQITTIPVQTFDPSRVCRSYTNTQWTLKEDWYVTKVTNLVIPLSPSPADIANMANDLERLLGKVSYGSANPRDLIAFRNSLQMLPAIKTVVSGFEKR